MTYLRRSACLVVLVFAVFQAYAQAPICVLPRQPQIEYSCPFDCDPNQPIFFQLRLWSESASPCWTYRWTFGDGTRPSERDIASTSHVFERPGSYEVTLTVLLPSGEGKSATTVVAIRGPGGGGPIPPSVTLSVPTPRPTANEPVLFVATAVSPIPVTEWSWTFGSVKVPMPIAGHAASTTYTFAEPGAYSVEAAAKNQNGFGRAKRTIVVAPVAPQQFAITLPVVTRQAGASDSFWRTDLHGFIPSPATLPLELTLQYGDITSVVTVESSTFVVRDLLSYVASTGGGVLRVRGKALTTPQLWTRTYNTGGGGTFGQRIPVFEAPAAANPGAGPPAPSPLIIGGLQDTEQFRTNVGLVNLSSAAMSVEIRPVGLVVTPVIVEVPAGTLIQINPASHVPALKGSSYGLRITSSDSASLYAYGSVIDSATNDPTFVEAVRQDRLTGTTRVIPGMGRVGAWRSDVMLLNPHTEPAYVRLKFMNESGRTVSTTSQFILAASESRILRDVLGNPAFSPEVVEGSVGSVEIIVDYGPMPFAFGRTYSAQDRGTFGQGIAPFQRNNANVRFGQRSVIGGLLENEAAYTNLGLVAASADRSVVKVTLIRGQGGEGNVESTFSVDGYGSRMIGHILAQLAPGATAGTLELELVSGGPVWAYGSLVDRMTTDPEYIPAAMLP